MDWSGWVGQKLSLPVFISWIHSQALELRSGVRSHTGNQSAKGETISTCKLNWNKNKHRGQPYYFSVTSKWHACSLRPESIFVVTMKIPQFPLFNKVLLVCVPLPAEQCHGSLPLGNLWQESKFYSLHIFIAYVTADVYLSVNKITRKVTDSI